MYISAREAGLLKHSTCVPVETKQRKFAKCQNGCGARKLVWHVCDVTIARRHKWAQFESTSSWQAVADTEKPHICDGKNTVNKYNMPVPVPQPPTMPSPAAQPMMPSPAAQPLPPPRPPTVQPIWTAGVEQMWPDEVKPVVVEEVHKAVHGYFPQNSEWDELLLSAKLGQPTLLVGPAGCGKTQLVEALSAELNRRVYTLQGGQGVLFEHVYGHFNLEAGATVWKDGLVTEACRANEKAILYLDEPNALDDGIRYLLHGLLDHRRGITLYENNNEEVVAPNLVIVASLNAGRDQGASASLSPPAGAFLSRFLKIPLDYLPEVQEATLLEDRTKVGKKVAALMVAVAVRIRKARTEKNATGIAPLARTTPCGTRTLLQWAQRVAAGSKVRKAAQMCIVGLGGTPAEEQALREVIDAVLPSDVR